MTTADQIDCLLQLDCFNVNLNCRFSCMTCLEQWLQWDCKFQELMICLKSYTMTPETHSQERHWRRLANVPRISSRNQPNSSLCFSLTQVSNFLPWSILLLHPRSCANWDIVIQKSDSWHLMTWHLTRLVILISKPDEFFIRFLMHPSCLLNLWWWKKLCLKTWPNFVHLNSSVEGDSRHTFLKTHFSISQ